MLVTNQLIEQVYLVPDITSKLTRFDRLRWYRSATGRNGYFEPATSVTEDAAMLRAVSVTRALNGKTLKLRVNGVTEVVVVIADPDPVELSTLALAIEDASALLTAFDDDNGVLIVQTVAVGSQASIEVLECDAAAYIGLLPGECAIGTDQDNTLASGVSEYRLQDHQGSNDMWYSVELLHSVTGVRSGRSIAFASRALESVPLSQLIGCYVRLCDLQGRPRGGQRVIIHNVFLPNRTLVGDKAWGVFRQYEEVVTDPNGYAQIWLLRGAVVDVTVAGTGFTRRVVVPSAGSVVDLLDPSLSSEDEFGIQQPAIDFAIRTS